MKRKYQVIKRVTRKTDLDPLFGKSNSFLVKDAGEATAINDKYGKRGTQDVHVMEDERTPAYQATEGGIHHWTFSVPQLPWKKDPEPRKDDGWVEVSAGRWKKVENATQKREVQQDHQPEHQQTSA